MVNTTTDKKAFFGRQADRQTERQTGRQTDSCHIPSMITFLGQMYLEDAGLIIIFTYFDFFFQFCAFLSDNDNDGYSVGHDFQVDSFCYPNVP